MSAGQDVPTRGYYRKPHQLRTDSRRQGEVTYKFVDFLTDLTFGWDSRWVLLSYDEIINGRLLSNGTRMPNTASGLLDPKSIRKAIALALEAELIEVRDTRWGTAYAIHHQYWALVNFLPKWEFFGARHYNPETDPLTPSAGQHPASDEEEDENQSPTPGYHPAGGETPSSKQSSVIQQPEFQQQATQSLESALEEGQRKKKDTSPNTSKIETEDRYVAPSARSPSARPISVSKTEQEENEDPPAPACSPREQAPLRAGESSQSNDTSQGRIEAPAPARTAELEAARQKQREAIDARRQAQELERKAKLEAERIARAAKEAEHRAVGKLQERYDALVLAKQKSEQGSPAWQQANEELQEVKHQLAAHGWYL